MPQGKTEMRIVHFLDIDTNKKQTNIANITEVKLAYHIMGRLCTLNMKELLPSA